MNEHVCLCVCVRVVAAVTFPTSTWYEAVYGFFIVDVYVMVCVTIQYYDEANDLLYLNIFYSVMF